LARPGPARNNAQVYLAVRRLHESNY
jgi:hypothetical protein